MQAAQEAMQRKFDEDLSNEKMKHELSLQNEREKFVEMQRIASRRVTFQEHQRPPRKEDDAASTTSDDSNPSDHHDSIARAITIMSESVAKLTANATKSDTRTPRARDVKDNLDISCSRKASISFTQKREFLHFDFRVNFPIEDRDKPPESHIIEFPSELSSDDIKNMSDTALAAIDDDVQHILYLDSGRYANDFRKAHGYEQTFRMKIQHVPGKLTKDCSKFFQRLRDFLCRKNELFLAFFLPEPATAVHRVTMNFMHDLFKNLLYEEGDVQNVRTQHCMKAVPGKAGHKVDNHDSRQLFIGIIRLNMLSTQADFNATKAKIKSFDFTKTANFQRLLALWDELHQSLDMLQNNDSSTCSLKMTLLEKMPPEFIYHIRGDLHELSTDANVTFESFKQKLVNHHKTNVEAHGSQDAWINSIKKMMSSNSSERHNAPHFPRKIDQIQQFHDKRSDGRQQHDKPPSKFVRSNNGNVFMDKSNKSKLRGFQINRKNYQRLPNKGFNDSIKRKFSYRPGAPLHTDPALKPKPSTVPLCKTPVCAKQSIRHWHRDCPHRQGNSTSLNHLTEDDRRADDINQLEQLIECDHCEIADNPDDCPTCYDADYLHACGCVEITSEEQLQALIAKEDTTFLDDPDDDNDTPEHDVLDDMFNVLSDQHPVYILPSLSLACQT